MHRVTEQSTSGSLGDILGSESLPGAVQKECVHPPNVQVHRCALVLQATNAGVRRPRYEATLGEKAWVQGYSGGEGLGTRLLWVVSQTEIETIVLAES